MRGDWDSALEGLKLPAHSAEALMETKTSGIGEQGQEMQMWERPEQR